MITVALEGVVISFEIKWFDRGYTFIPTDFAEAIRACSVVLNFAVSRMWIPALSPAIVKLFSNGFSSFINIS